MKVVMVGFLVEDEQAERFMRGLVDDNPLAQEALYMVKADVREPTGTEEAEYKWSLENEKARKRARKHEQNTHTAIDR